MGVSHIVLNISINGSKPSIDMIISLYTSEQNVTKFSIFHFFLFRSCITTTFLIKFYIIVINAKINLKNTIYFDKLISAFTFILNHRKLFDVIKHPPKCHQYHVYSLHNNFAFQILINKLKK